jgi:hypothetical protein
MITFVQNLVDSIAYTAARDQALAAGHDLETAIEMGNQTVRDTQASGESAYQAEVLRGNSWKKLFTTFFGPMLAQYNLFVSAVNERNRDKGRGAGIKADATLAAQYAFIFLVGPAYITLMREITKGDLGDDDDLEHFAWEWFIGQTGVVMLLRDAAQAAGSYAGYEGPPGLRPIATVGDTAQRVRRAWAKDDYDAVSRELTRGVWTVAGAVLHLPTGSFVNRPWRAYEAWSKGELEVDLLRASLFGFDPEGYDKDGN